MNEECRILLDCLPKPPKYEYDWAGLNQVPELANWFQRMSETLQNPEWHGEGDVCVHTKLVCEALTGLQDFRNMEAQNRDALALAALLHDIGKVTATRLDDGAWVAPRHGPVGASMARSLLWRTFGLCGTPQAQQFREAVCLMIRYHTRPVHMLEGNAPAVAALKLAANGALAPLFTLKALCLLAEADRMGSVASDTPRRMEEIEMGRLLAAEEGCFEGPYPFSAQRTQRALFSGGSVWKDQDLYDDSWGEVILMCGLPGTGKDTWIRANHPELPVVSLDDLRQELGVEAEKNQSRVVQAAKERAKALLRDKQPFIWNATSLTVRRAQQVDLFERYHARVRLVYLETAWEENLRRNANRTDAVPEGVLYDMLDRLEPPERYEAQEVEWICV